MIELLYFEQLNDILTEPNQIVQELYQSYIQNNNKWINTDIKLNWNDFMDLCLLILNTTKGFSRNFNNTSKLLDTDHLMELTNDHFYKFNNIVRIINERRQKNRINNKSSWKQYVKDKKHQLESEWYIGMFRLYSKIMKNHITIKYPIFKQNYSFVMENVILLCNIACNNEMKESYVEIINCHDTLKNIYDDIIDTLLPKFVLNTFLGTLDSLISLYETNKDNFTASYYITLLNKDPELKFRLSQYIWNNPELSISEFLYKIEPDDTIAKSIETNLKEYQIANSKLNSIYAGTDVGIWLYSGYFYYMHLYEDFDIELLQNKISIEERSLDLKQKMDNLLKSKNNGDNIFDFFCNAFSTMGHFEKYLEGFPLRKEARDYFLNIKYKNRIILN